MKSHTKNELSATQSRSSVAEQLKITNPPVIFFSYSRLIVILIKITMKKKTKIFFLHNEIQSDPTRGFTKTCFSYFSHNSFQFNLFTSKETTKIK